MERRSYRKLFRQRLAMLLVFVLMLTGTVPAYAEELPQENTAGSAAAEIVSGGDPAAEAVSAEDIAGEETAGPVSGDAGRETVSEDAGEETVSEDTGEEAVSGNTSENAAGEEEEKADATIMYYLVGSNLEGSHQEATRDMVEVMTGLRRAEEDGAKSKVNVIVETGGVSFRADDNETEEEKRKGYKAGHDYLKEEYSVSEEAADSYKLLMSANGEEGFRWDKNERWEISAGGIKRAKNDDGMDRDRIMSGHKETGDAPELTDFIRTTAEKYPAENYMLVLWDHGGGPEGGYAGDDRVTDSNKYGYITSDQLSKTLSDASVQVGKKFAFIGFDACLMGNLETAMALTPYADYLFASEDIESGEGWDHRGYVQQMLTNDPDSYEPASIKKTTENIGVEMAGDMISWYEKEGGKATVCVISLNETQLGELDQKLGALADDIRENLLATSDGKFIMEKYPLFLEALQRSIHFNGDDSGIVDLYSFCEEVSKIHDVGEIDDSAHAVQEALKPGEFQCDNKNGSNIGPVICERYTSSYPFADGGDDKDSNLGGLTVYFPHENFRVEYGDEEKTVTDYFKSYLDIYYNSDNSKIIKDDNKLGNGYRSLLETFCTIRVMGSSMSDGFDKKDEEVLSILKKAADAVKNDYKLTEKSIAFRTADNMSVSNGLVRNRISENDVRMRTIVSDGSIICVYDVDETKTKMINRINQQLQFTGEDGRVHRLGYISDMNKPSSVQGKEGRSRYIPLNRYDEKWFFMGDVPASIYSIQDISPDPERNFYNALDDNRTVIVQIPAAVRRSEESSEELVIIEAEVGSGSSNVVPRGYYRIDVQQKLLYGFIPWDDVSGNATFQAVSDLAEYITGETSDFKILSFGTVYGEPMEKSEVRINRNKAVASDNRTVTSRYIMTDVFGGRYELDCLNNGEAVTVSVALSQNGKAVSDDYIDAGAEDVYPVFTYRTAEYSLSLNKDLPIGYRDASGGFHELKDSSDFKALGTGTIDIVFRDYDEKEGVIGVTEKDVTVSVDGAEKSWDPAYYLFMPEYDPALTLTVGNKNEPLSITKKADIPYGFTKTLSPWEDLPNFISVRNGNGDVTRSLKTGFIVSANGQEFDLYDDSRLNDFRKLDLKPGSRITVSASFSAGEETIYTPAAVELTVVRQPVKLLGANAYETWEFLYSDTFWEKDYPSEYYTPSVKVLMQYGGQVYDDREFGAYIGKELHISKLVSADTVSEVSIDIHGISGAGDYEDLPIGPRITGRKRPGAWEDKYLDSAFAQYYNVEDAVLQYYMVKPAADVYFRSLKAGSDGEELCPSVLVTYDKEAEKDGLRTVSDGAISMSGDPVKQWYMRIGNEKRVPVWLDGEAVSYYDYAAEKYQELVISENGAWWFFLPESASSNEVVFYAGYEESVATITETTKGSKKFNITADRITPAEYTGKAIVTTASGKSGSRVIDLCLRDENGTVLTEGKDYTVSYRYNKNVAGPGDKKAPTLKIKGKGQTYRGYAAEISFTILPADLYYADVAVTKSFAPFTSKGKLNTGISVRLQSGVKVPAANTQILYYDEDDNLLTSEMMKEYYRGDSPVPVKIVVTGKNNTKKNAVNNYMAGSKTAAVYVTGYPRGSKNLSVKLSSSRQKFESGKPVSVIELAARITRKDRLKIGQRRVEFADLKEVTAYLDKNLTKPAANDGTLMDRAGTYYLAYELSDEKKSRDYPAYRASAVKFVLSGKAIKKGKTKLSSKVLSYNGAGNNVSVNIVIDRKKLDADEMYLTYTTRDGSTGGGTVGYNDNPYGKQYDFMIDKDGNLFTDDIDNGARGSYSLTLTGRGAYTGSVKLSYKVK